MASIGPTLPPHLQKRKREEERDSNPRPESRSRSSSADTGIKRRRVLGPAPPPAPIDEKPPNSPREEKNGDESDSDDGYGPAPAPALHQVVVVDDGQHVETKDTEVDEVQKPQREEWMLAPPTGGDWNSRVDPTKLKNRRFNTGKGARGPPQVQSTGGTLWTETPEQKRKRLQDEVLGVANPSTSEQAKSKKSKDQTGDRKIERRIQDYKDRNSAKSLYEQHQRKKSYDEDDPSKRAFDREKDVGSSMMSSSKRKEFMNKVTGYGTKFSRGTYL